MIEFLQALAEAIQTEASYTGWKEESQGTGGYQEAYDWYVRSLVKARQVTRWDLYLMG